MNDADKLYELYEAMRAADEAHDNAELQRVVQLARKMEGRDAFAWHSAALDSDDRKWFTAWVYERKPIPRALARAFIAAALRTNHAHRNQFFITPVLETYGREFTLLLLDEESKREGISPDAIGKARYYAQQSPRRSRGTAINPQS